MITTCTDTQVNYRKLRKKERDRIAVCIRIGGVSAAKKIYGTQKAFAVWTFHPFFRAIRSKNGAEMLEGMFKYYYIPAILKQIDKPSPIWHSRNFTKFSK